jgi:hypothetical protein
MNKIKAYIVDLFNALRGRGPAVQDTGGGTVPTNQK